LDLRRARRNKASDGTEEGKNCPTKLHGDGENSATFDAATAHGQIENAAMSGAFDG
jgi:hypothetical protein